ncbi:MAG: bifunctional adenosylcobinamide kinase/adenosylcobinamide-phosphate guanylyltransferase [Eubacteriales bacterium]|nr:bifunctional adenosylcobinamide kinase/adenosylcobinamide-phosphate guanylyltransferase [Eubacteriales bacterium]
MILVTGGAFQGKKEYVTRQFGILPQEMTDGAKCSWDELRQCRCLVHFHLFIKRMMEGQEDPSDLCEILMEENPDLIIVTNEVGYGIVPMERFEREYREKCGRICCEIAKEAVEVHRVICGIGQVIKRA